MSENLLIRNKFVYKIMKQTDRLNNSLHLLYKVDKLLLTRKQKGGTANNELQELWKLSSNVTGSSGNSGNTDIIKQVNRLSEELGNKLKNLKEVLAIVNTKLANTKSYDLSQNDVKVDNTKIKDKMNEFHDKLASNTSQLRENKPLIANANNLLRSITDDDEDDDEDEDENDDEEELKILKPLSIRPTSPTMKDLEQGRSKLKSHSNIKDNILQALRRPTSPSMKDLEQGRSKLKSQFNIKENIPRSPAVVNEDVNQEGGRRRKGRKH